MATSRKNTKHAKTAELQFLAQNAKKNIAIKKTIKMTELQTLPDGIITKITTTVLRIDPSGHQEILEETMVTITEKTLPDGRTVTEETTMVAKPVDHGEEDHGEENEEDDEEESAEGEEEGPDDIQQQMLRDLQRGMGQLSVFQMGGGGNWPGGQLTTVSTPQFPQMIIQKGG